MKIIVHLGMPKTGSSSIQQSLYNNKELENICYPDFGEIGNHQWLLNRTFESFSSKLRENSSLDFISFEKQKINRLRKLEKLLDSSFVEKRDILLSAETLCLKLGANELKELHSLLTNYTKEIIAVAYVRSPKSYIESAFQQTLKFAVLSKGVSKDSRAKTVVIKQRFPRYQTWFEKFDQIFGEKNVYFWKFDPSTFPNNCVVTDFCQRLNINISSDSIIRVNEGLSSGAVSLLYAYLTYEKKSSVTKKKFIDLLCQYQDGKRLRFSSAIIAPILEENRTHIEWMENRAGISLAEDIFKDDQDAIHSKDELLTFTTETLQWLAKQLGGDYLERWHPQMTSEEVGQWIDNLNLKFCQKL